MACGTIVGNQTGPRVTAIAWEQEMREKTLGRWIVRLAVTVGAGSLALGLSAAAAHADTSQYARFNAHPTTLVGVAQLSPAPEPIFFTEDFTWD
nr:hypothetical protein GCM10020063_095260 [Dactylosporangium thailandense]